MPSPWDDKQKPHEKSKFHGKKDKDHGPHERGLGAKVPPGLEDKKAEDPDADEQVPAVGASGLASAAGEEAIPLAGAYPSYAYVKLSTRPPGTNQGTDPMCVPHASAYDQNQHDRPESGQFWDFNRSLFFSRIGGNAYGSSITSANQERIDQGYPVKNLGHAGSHRIRRAISLDKTVNAVKDSISKGHGGLILIPWFQSWFHPLASGKLPWPDYFVGYHEVWYYGYNDNIGIWIQNSWGTEYGISGRVALPYTHLWRARVIHRTVDV